MMRWLLWIALVGSAFGQQVMPILGSPVAPSGGGTVTFVQQGDCVTSTATSCTITLGSALTAGNIYTVMGQMPNFASISITSITTSSPAETYTNGSNLIAAPGCSMGAGTLSWYPWCAYVLAANAVGGGSTLTVNFSASPGNNGGVLFQEWHPSANGTQIALQSDNSFAQPTASTSLVGPAFTASGTNGFTMQGIAATGSFVSPSAVSSLYSAHDYLALIGFAGAVSVVLPTWSMASSIGGISNEMSFAYNPSSYLEEGFEDFEGVTPSGTAPTAANLATGMHGWQGCLWEVSHVALMTSLSAASIPLANATGLLNDGVSYAAGAGTLGMGITYNGSDASDYITCDWGNGASSGSLASPNISIGLWWYGDQPGTGNNNNIDGPTLHGTSDFAAVNYYSSGTAGNLAVKLETPEGNGSVVNTPTSTWLWLGLVYQAGGTGTLSVYDCSSGSPPSCPLQLLGTSSHALNTTPDYAYKAEFGQSQGSEAPTSGTHTYFDSLKLSLTGASLMP